MEEKDVFLGMIEEEFNQFGNDFLFQQKKWLRDGEYKKAAEHSLRKTRIYGVVVIFSIITFSLLSVYHFIQYGTNGGTTTLILGISTWAFVIFSTIIYTRDVLVRKRSMLRILKLLEARKEYLNKKTSNQS